VYELQSNNKSFVQEAVQGGVCAYNSEYRKKEITSGVADFDMNSMYPSAMMHIGQECGYPRGPAKKIPHSSLVYPLLYFHYMVRIHISAINKFQQIPLVSVKVKSGSIKKYNMGDIPEETFVVDKVTLEDWIEFCRIEFELIEELFWDNGGIHECADTITDLKQLRDEYKREGNDLQQDVKLIMNMGYGTLVLKKVGKSIVIKEHSEEATDYVSERFGIFKSWTRFSKHVEIKMAKYNEDYSRNHLGCLILSMSKCYLDEVLNICQDYGIIVYYVDMDSIHIEKNKISYLKRLYFERYHKPLIGKALRQFHCDFNIKCGHNERMMSHFTILLGPKVYFDDLHCEECGQRGHH